MELFLRDGHLTNEAFEWMLKDEDSGLLERLELAEHLAYCDVCLQRYTDILSDETLLTPTHSCQRSLWSRIWAKSLQTLTSRYATAAAAVALVLTVIWGSGQLNLSLPTFPQEEDRPMVTWSERWSESLHEVVSSADTILDHIGGRESPSTQGGAKK